MQLRDAIDRVAADAREMSHSNGTLAVLVDERHARDASFVTEEAHAHDIEEASIDLVDDLEVSREHFREQTERPAFERFGKERVIRVRERLGRDRPGLFPRHDVFIDEQAHELRDSDRGMRIVQLNGELLVEALERDALNAHDAEHVLQ
jgi:hypothetical protein